ncbi:hypothetical protein PybrP1_010254, partial [[Pythium] brassicae (nom. inval.)]
MTPAVPLEWHPDAVVARAKELIHSSNYERVGEARKAVDDTLARWAAAAQQPQPQPGDAAARVAELWGRYAALEIELRQFKQATKVFERAVACPVAGARPALWLQYAAFCVERSKFSNARKIYVRGLHAVVAAPDRDALWTAFHAFVVAHVEPAMTLDTLRAQVPLASPAAAAVAPTPPLPVQSTSPVAAEPLPSPLSPPPHGSHSTVATPPTATSAAAPPAEDAAPAAPFSPSSPSTSVLEPALAIDPALAFVDTTGEPEPRAHEPASAKKRSAADTLAETEEDSSKRAKPGAESSDSVRYFRQIPTTLPRVPACPHLLFDAARAGEIPLEVGEELLERLSDVLRDSAVFQGVAALCATQRQRDRETLYRWQDLVGMQMKEGSELFARHAAATSRDSGAADPREQAEHAAQRREFTARCRMSQQQFIEITGIDRLNALKAQQISLENMKIPEMTVTSDPEAVTMQRAILGLILEAEKIWREEMAKIAAANAAAQSPPAKAKKKASPELRGSAGPTSAAHGPRGGTAAYYHPKQSQQTQQQDASYSHAGRGGFRSARGGRGGADRPSHARAAASGYGGSRGPPSRRDYEPLSPSSSYAQSTPHAAGYDHHGARQQLHARPTGGYQGQQQQQQRAPSGFADRSLAHEYSSNFAPPPQETHRGRFAGPSYGGDSGGASAWEQPPRQARGGDFGPGTSRYGGGGVLSDGGRGGGGHLPPQAVSYANGPKPSRGRAFGAGGAMASSPPGQYGGGYGAFQSGPQRDNAGYAPPQQHQQQHSPPYSGYQGDDDYAASPPSAYASYSARNPAPYQPPQQQQQGPPPQQQPYHQFHQPTGSFQQRGGRGGGGGGGGGGYGHPQQQQQQPSLHSHLGQQQAQGYSRGGGGFRRGGGGR